MERTRCKYLGPKWLGGVVITALVMVALSFVLLAGCEKKAPEKPKADPPSVYMKDPAFRGALAEKKAERMKILGSREKVLVALEKLIDEKRAAMPNADDAAIKIELEKDPEYQSLLKRLADANTAFEDNRAETTKVVRDRIRPKKNLK